MVAPGVATVAIYAFVVAWTEYAFSSTLLLGEQVKTLPLGLDMLVAQYRVDWGMMTAASTLTALPVAILFGFIGRYFVHSLAGSMNKVEGGPCAPPSTRLRGELLRRQAAVPRSSPLVPRLRHSRHRS